MPEPWWRGPMIGLDLETTSASPEEARIVSAAVATVGDGPTRIRSWLADPGVPIPDEAAAIHGVTTERAQVDGQPVAEVVREVLDALIAEGVAVRPLVIFNAPYDLTVLDRERTRHGVDHPPLAEWRRLRIVDPLVIDKWLDRFRKGSRKLDAICEAYGAKLDAAHDADSDALAACRAAFVLGARGKVIRNIRPYRQWDDRRELRTLQATWAAVQDDLALLHGAQIEWYHEQATGLREHFAKKGDHEAAARVTTSWPLIPVAVAEPA